MIKDGKMKKIIAFHIFAILLPLVFGCQTYRPMVVDLDRHLEGWQNLDLEEICMDEAIPVGDAFDEAPSIVLEDGLSLEEAEWVILFLNADLRLARSELSVLQASAEKSGILDDPSIELGFKKISDPVDFPEIWESAIGLPLPLFGRLNREKEKAWAEYNALEKQVAASEWDAIIDLRSLWVTWSSLKGQTELTGRYLAQLDDLHHSVAQLASVGELDSTEARVFEIEHAQMQTELIDLKMETELVRQEILKALGLHPEANPEFKARVSLFLNEDSQEGGHLKIPDNHPQLSRFNAELEAAEKRLHLEIRRQYPDLILSPSYGIESDIERRGIGLSLALPLWNRNRQAIAEATADRDLARRRLESEYEDLVHQLYVASERLYASQRMLEIMKDVTIPLADLQFDEVRKLLEAGEIDVLLIKDALAGSLRSKREVLEMRAEEANAINAVQAILEPTGWVPLENGNGIK